MAGDILRDRPSLLCSIVTLAGSNLGACPVVLWATYVLPFCGPSGLLSSSSPKFDPGASLSADQTTLTFTAPAGEGDGTIVTSSALGWAVSVQAADQLQVGSAIAVGYAPPSNVAATNAVGGMPTVGGVTLSITGSGFGASVPGFPQSLLPPFLQLRVYIGSGNWTDPLTPNATSQPPVGSVFGSPGGTWRSCASPQRIDSSRITCTLPAGAGSSLFVRVSVAGQQVQSAAASLSYDPPTLASVAALEMIASAGSSGAVAGPTAGGYTLTLTGSDFGPGGTSPQQEFCVFMLSRKVDTRATPLLCDGYESFEGEGEIYLGDVLSWSHR